MFATNAILSLFVFLAVCIVAAGRLRRSGQENPPSRLRRWIEDTFCQPAYAVSVYYRWLKRGLQRNPIGWLEKRRWSGRLTTGIWLAIGLGFLIGALTNPPLLGDREGLMIITFFFWPMAINMAIMAAGSFGRERATGVMELLLISPLNERQIISARLRGIWAQFLPGALLLGADWCIAQILVGPRGDFYADVSRGLTASGDMQVMLAYFPVMLLTLPVIGLYYSLRFRTYLTAMIVTLLVGLVIPWTACHLGLRGFEAVEMEDSWTFFVELLLRNGSLPMFYQVVVALLLLRWLHRRLVQRHFSYQRS